MSEDYHALAKEELAQHPRFKNAPQQSQQWLIELYAYAKEKHGTTLRAPASQSITLDPNYVCFHNIRTTGEPGFYIDLYGEPQRYEGILSDDEINALKFSKPRESASRIKRIDPTHLDAIKRLMDRSWHLKSER